jgi:S1-C subfamily serine protease
MRKFLPYVLVAALAACATSAQTQESTTFTAPARPAQAQVQVQLTWASQPVNDQNAAITVYQQNGASVVNITSIAVIASRQGPVTQPQGIGSGFMVDNEGRIITNNHVVQDANQIEVTFQDRTTTQAKLIGRDPDNDLAVIQVDPNGVDDQGNSLRDRIKPVTLADSNQVVIGQTAVAVGSPLGLRQTVTEGIVSARRPPGEASESAAAQLDLLGGAIQTDAAINPGNSGGPLFNSAGQVIGVNSAILSQSGGNEGIGFAIPTSTVGRVVPELIQTGTYHHPLLGIRGVSLSSIGPTVRQQLGLPPNAKGVLVIESTGPAQQAGIRGGTHTVVISGQAFPAGGDIIIAIDGLSVSTSGELRAYIENNKHPGDTVRVSILRDGQTQDVVVTLGDRPAGTSSSPTGGG